MDLSTIINFFKLPRKAIFLVALITGVMLFSSTQFLTKLALYDLKEEFKLWIGCVFLFSSGISIINSIEFLISYVKAKRIHKEKIEQEKREKRENKKKYFETLNALDNHELSCIREFFVQQKNTIEMPSNDPVVIGLIQKQVLKQVGKGYEIKAIGRIASFSIHTNAMEYFKKFDFNKIDKVDRPKWVNDLAKRDQINQEITEFFKQIRP